MSKTDVQLLKTTGRIAESTIISGKEVFSYALEREEKSLAMGAFFNRGQLVIWLPAADCNRITDTPEMSVQGYQDNGEEGGLYLLVEKDLQCLDATDEDQSDFYENPKSSC